MAHTRSTPVTERASEHERRNPRHIYTRYRLSLGDVWCRRHFVSDTKATGALDARRKFPLSKENARSLLALAILFILIISLRRVLSAQIDDR